MHINVYIHIHIFNLSFLSLALEEGEELRKLHPENRGCFLPPPGWLHSGLLPTSHFAQKTVA